MQVEVSNGVVEVLVFLEKVLAVLQLLVMQILVKAAQEEAMLVEEMVGIMVVVVDITDLVVEVLFVLFGEQIAVFLQPMLDFYLLKPVVQ